MAFAEQEEAAPVELADASTVVNRDALLQQAQTLQAQAEESFAQQVKAQQDLAQQAIAQQSRLQAGPTSTPQGVVVPSAQVTQPPIAQPQAVQTQTVQTQTVQNNAAIPPPPISPQNQTVVTQSVTQPPLPGAVFTQQPSREQQQSVVTSTTSSQEISADQFQAWLRNNSVKQNPTNKTYAFNRVTSTSHTRKRVTSPRRPLTYEQGQRIMRNSAPASLVPPDPDSAVAFDAMMQQNMPLTPRQVVQLRQQIDRAQLAASIAPNIPPKPVSTTLMVNLAPGTTPPAVRLAQGYVTSLVFVDSTGAPWPIASFDIGNPKALNIQWDGKSNILLLQAVLPYSNGDIVVRLVGLPTPVTLELVSGQRVVDYRVDLHVSGLGPNTKELPLGTDLPNSANQLLLGVLDGIAPPGSKPLIVHGADSQAWLVGDKMYLRTRLTLLSPGWVGKMSSIDGMQAYELARTSSVLVSRYGEPAELKIEGF